MTQFKANKYDYHITEVERMNNTLAMFIEQSCDLPHLHSYPEVGMCLDILNIQPDSLKHYHDAMFALAGKILRLFVGQDFAAAWYSHMLSFDGTNNNPYHNGLHCAVSVVNVFALRCIWALQSSDSGYINLGEKNRGDTQLLPTLVAQLIAMAYHDYGHSGGSLSDSINTHIATNAAVAALDGFVNNVSSTKLFKLVSGLEIASTTESYMAFKTASNSNLVSDIINNIRATEFPKNYKDPAKKICINNKTTMKDIPMVQLSDSFIKAADLLGAYHGHGFFNYSDRTLNTRYDALSTLDEYDTLKIEVLEFCKGIDPKMALYWQLMLFVESLYASNGDGFSHRHLAKSVYNGEFYEKSAQFTQTHFPFMVDEALSAYRYSEHAPVPSMFRWKHLSDVTSHTTEFYPSLRYLETK